MGIKKYIKDEQTKSIFPFTYPLINLSFNLPIISLNKTFLLIGQNCYILIVRIYNEQI